MKRSRLTRKTPLSRGKPLKRRKPVSPANKKRREKQRTEAFGERAPLVREMRCLCAQFGRWYAPGTWHSNLKCEGPVQACHVRSRGAGGTRRDLIPLCSGHHREQHTRGLETFSTRYGLDLTEHAARIAAELDARGVP